jgi:hypothetical protein
VCGLGRTLAAAIRATYVGKSVALPSFEVFSTFLKKSAEVLQKPKGGNIFETRERLKCVELFKNLKIPEKAQMKICWAALVTG